MITDKIAKGLIPSFITISIFCVNTNKLISAATTNSEPINTGASSSQPTNSNNANQLSLKDLLQTYFDSVVRQEISRQIERFGKPEGIDAKPTDSSTGSTTNTDEKPKEDPPPAPDPEAGIKCRMYQGDTDGLLKTLHGIKDALTNKACTDKINEMVSDLSNVLFNVNDAARVRLGGLSSTDLSAEFNQLQIASINLNGGASVLAPRAAMATRSRDLMTNLAKMVSDKDCLQEAKGKNVMSLFADATLTAGQFALSYPNRDGLIYGGAGLAIGASIKILLKMFTANFNWRISDDRVTFSKMNCTFYNLRSELEARKFFSTESSNKYFMEKLGSGGDSSRDELMREYESIKNMLFGGEGWSYIEFLKGEMRRALAQFIAEFNIWQKTYETPTPSVFNSTANACRDARDAILYWDTANRNLNMIHDFFITNVGLFKSEKLISNKSRLLFGFIWVGQSYKISLARQKESLKMAREILKNPETNDTVEKLNAYNQQNKTKIGKTALEVRRRVEDKIKLEYFFNDPKNDCANKINDL